MQHYSTSNTKENKANKITKILLLVYLITLIWILLFKLGVHFSYMDKREVNLIPFGRPLILNSKVDFGEIFLNVVIFIPFGIYTGVLRKRWTFGKKFFLFFLTSLIIEALQFIFKIGAFDITDIITNTSGGIIGLLIYFIIEKLFNNSAKAQKFINIIAAFGTILIVLFLALLKLNMLPIRYR